MFKNKHLHTFTEKTKILKTVCEMKQKIFKMTIIKEHPIKQ
ncbi:hypothetical protein O23A_p1742 [Aeromonas salmonicida]|nr:hypothetical protein O23A_p1742 [Aeromonas salmonicida]